MIFPPSHLIFLSVYLGIMDDAIIYPSDPILNYEVYIFSPQVNEIYLGMPSIMICLNWKTMMLLVKMEALQVPRRSLLPLSQIKYAKVFLTDFSHVKTFFTSSMLVGKASSPLGLVHFKQSLELFVSFTESLKLTIYRTNMKNGRVIFKLCKKKIPTINQ